MILLDTNVISEIYRPLPNATAMAWLNSQLREMLFLCTPALAELRFGIERLATGKRRDRLSDTVDQLQNGLYRDRILVFDIAAASEYGRIAAKRQRAGRPIGQLDAMIASIAVVRGSTLATRNVNDFSDLGLDLINPFETTMA
jgi:predicted nucleic acid-binding protein